MNGYAYNGAYQGNSMDNDDDGADNDMMMMGNESMGHSGTIAGQSLDDIVSQNSKMIRRQSMPQSYGSSPHHLNQDMRRISMMNYGAGSPEISGYSSYTPNNAATAAAMDQSTFTSGAVTPNAAHQNVQQRRLHSNRRPSAGELSLTTNFQNNPQNFNNLMPSHSAYASSPAHAQTALDGMAMESPYDGTMGMSMDYGMDQGLNSAVSTDPMQMHLYNQPQFAHTEMTSPMNPPQAQGTPQSGRMSSHDRGQSSGMHTQYSNQDGNAAQPTRHGHLSRTHSLHIPDLSSPAHTASPMSAPPASSHGQSSRQQQQTSAQHASGASNQPPHRGSAGFQRQPQHPTPGSRQDRGVGQMSTEGYDGVNGPVAVSAQNYNPNNQNFPWDAPEGGWPSTMVGKPHMSSVYKNAYSSTGFDMLGVLMRVATRPNPEINIGSVDLSCAFVVCDAEKDDFPIVYCSDNFERLTGYTKHMILGRNCRFLQSPDGNVAPGIKRKYVDDDSVLYLKNMINLRREAQISLINYRRGGQPFMNLLTMIPITWDTDQVKFFVGFQVDLVEQPNAVTNKNPDGSYSINYQRGMAMPRYVVNAPDSSSQKTELGQTVPRDDVSAILSTIGSGESEYAKRMWDKVLLENTDDVVHVLSLKGLFQWVSPSACRVLEYEPSEIIGTALSSVCHPSDIVPVTRELKDTSSGASVNVVFRIRRKNSGYMWFEGHGSLHTEQGKGRKSIIMVGRERPVYALSKTGIASNGGIGENELWTKLSTSGMFLFISSSVRQLLDRQPDELVGISIQTLMRTDSKTEFARILELARTGKRASVKHEMINRRGQVLSAYTTLYPGDAVEGQKPTFIVAQTRLIKFTRGQTTGSRPQIYAKNERNSSESVQSGIGQGSQQLDSTSSQTPNSARYVGTEGSAITYAGQNGLLIGRQDQSLASDDNLFEELKTTKSSSWQYEIRQLEKRNRMLAEEVQSLIAAKKKRKRRKGAGNQQKDCANCHTRVTPEWRRGPSGQRDLCNSCGLRWAKLNGRVSPRTSSQHSVSDKASKASASPRHPSGVSGGNMIKTEDHHDPMRTGHANMGEPRGNLQVAHKPSEGYGASMEGASGVPATVVEEPD